MKTAGYSGKPLHEKLGIKPATTVLLKNAPRGYRKTLGDLPSGVSLKTAGPGPYPLVHLFVKSRQQLRTDLPKAKKSMTVNGMLWISWPKKSSRIETDVDENLVRHAGLAKGLVDVKICAVDEDWSALKFVIPLKLRPK
jgi:hypothetical protein